jgi:GNAT superfamily N-acetyltransferase
MIAASDSETVIRVLPEVTEADIAQLAALLVDCVEGGASVGFMLPLTLERAAAFWRRIAGDVAGGRRVLLVARDAGGITGTVQLIFDLPENQPHRADVAKMLVLRRARKRGIGAALMRAAETHAWAAGKTLLVLDTASGDAERLYARLGWQRVGTVPDYALWPEGGLCATHFFYRRVEPGRDSAQDGLPGPAQQRA